MAAAMRELPQLVEYLHNKQFAGQVHGRGSRTCPHNDGLASQIAAMDIAEQLRLLRRQLCVLSPNLALPEPMIADIDNIINHRRAQRVLYSIDDAQPVATFYRGDQGPGRILHWRGDITSLSNVTVVTNAANQEGLGCFQPTHKCIDNAVHSWAGPRLRLECAEVMRKRGRALSPGECFYTRGYCLPCDYVVHVVGPCVASGTSPKPVDFEQLQQCYNSVLDTAERIPASRNGRKSVALCGISTGIFGFPAQQAAMVAVSTVADWLERHPRTTITDIMFNTFTKEEDEIYEELLRQPPAAWTSWPCVDRRLGVSCDNMERAREWLRSADAVVVSAGAGLSAADGLDYTSTALFARHFPGFLRFGLRTLYSVFGFTDWPSEQDRWGYYLTHLRMVRDWPRSAMYERLLGWLGRFGEDAHVRTSNADGLFLANGCAPDRLSTPQGSYAVLQCLANCRPDATMPSEPFVARAASALDPVSQRLLDGGMAPRCRFCAGPMHICVRAGSWFNGGPFERGEAAWRAFRKRVLDEEKRVVILELGVGMATPPVLRWPNEKLVRRGKGKVRLVRVGLGSESAVPQDLDENELALSIEGDIQAVIETLIQ